DLVAKPVRARELQRLRADEPFHEREDVRVRASLHVAHRELLFRREEGELVDLRQRVGEELALEIERPPAKDIGLDVPAHPLRGFDAALVAGSIVGVMGWCGWRGAGSNEHIDGGVHGVPSHGWPNARIIATSSS